jgi:hypothetical protein
VFGQPGIIEQLGAWHYNGHTWSRVAKNIDGGSALAPNDVWAFSGTNVTHWNGRTWASTSPGSTAQNAYEAGKTNLGAGPPAPDCRSRRPAMAAVTRE